MSLTVESSTPKTPDHRHSSGEEAILSAAVQLFSEYGYDGVSMRSVARTAGVSKSNIYHHFESKEALYLAIMQSSASRFATLIENLAEGKGAFDERLRVFARSHLEHLFDNATTLRLILREAFAADEKRGRLLAERVFGGLFQRLIAIFESGQEAGVLRPGLDPALCALLIVGGDLFYFQSYGVLKFLPQSGFAQNRANYSRETMDIILNGMLAPADGRGVANA
jgi:TetR/AcrR family transcriptional regulator